MEAHGQTSLMIVYSMMMTEAGLTDSFPSEIFGSLKFMPDPRTSLSGERIFQSSVTT